ncbi:MAG: four helix bundle protein [Thermoguttaceae bacterium]|jgi:four helix bundle protein
MTDHAAHGDGESDKRVTYDLADRTARLGEAIIKFARSVRLDPITSPLVSQLVRAATSVGANYSEANDANSKKEFLYRISLCSREVRETKHWLRMLAIAYPIRKEQARVLWKESHELNLIFNAIYRKGKSKP